MAQICNKSVRSIPRHFVGSSIFSRFQSSSVRTKKILCVGAGLVAQPCIEYLSRDQHNAVKVIGSVETELDRIRFNVSRNNVTTELLDATKDKPKLDQQISESDLVISLLPAPLHPEVAHMCINHGCDMVTASYISPIMRELNDAAKEAGITILNEVGVDPGMDHMSAMRVIHEVQRDGGKITSFSSLCGGLPAPEAANNPLGYKFSWSPRGVLTAAQNSARYLESGIEVEVESGNLLASARVASTPWMGLNLEQLPNRDSIPYGELYGIQSADTVFRGTIRYRGWADIMHGFKLLGLLDDSSQMSNASAPKLWKTYMDELGLETPAKVESELKELGAQSPSTTVAALQWLGVFDDIPVDCNASDTRMDAFCNLLQDKLAMSEMDRDMIVMYHEFGASYPCGKKEIRKSSLLNYGVPAGDTAMASTVGLTTGIAADILLRNKAAIGQLGVIAPVFPEIYEPVLDALEKEGFAFTEETQVL